MDILSGEQYVKDGVLNAEGLALLQDRMPFCDFTEFAVTPRVEDFSELITVAAICNYLKTKVAVG